MLIFYKLFAIEKNKAEERFFRLGMNKINGLC